MKKNAFLISMIISLTICNFSFADKYERFQFSSKEDAQYKISVVGFFNKSGIVSPSDSIFVYHTINKKFFLGGYENFIFSGRTGDKTFELIYIIGRYHDTSQVSEIKRVKLNLFFEENGLCPLSFVGIHSGCPTDEKVFLKMIKLQGNQLEYQIILPSCLKKMKKEK